MSEYTFSVPIGSMDQIHAARDDGNGTATTACGLTKSIAFRNPIILDITEFNCQKCMDAMGWQFGILKDYRRPGDDVPLKGPKEWFDENGHYKGGQQT